MIALMLNAARQKPLRCQCTAAAAAVGILHRHALRALHITVALWHGEAPLRLRHASLTHGNDGIDELQEPMLILHVDHNDAQRLPHLRRSKTHAVSSIHRFRHIVEQLPMPLREAFDRLRRLFQDGIPRLLDVKYRHSIPHVRRR